MIKSDLPFGSEFSPSQIDLIPLLEICRENEGDKNKIEEKIRKRWFSRHADGNSKNQRTLAMNCRLGLVSYGLLDSGCNLTGLGEDLLSQTTPESAYEILARHILLHLNGMVFVECLQDMKVAGKKTTLTSIKAELENYGLFYPSGGKHPSIMRLWLEKAGVVDSQWNVDNSRVEDLVGLQREDFVALSSLTTEQRCFLLTLAGMDTSNGVIASQVVRLAEAVNSITFPEKSLPKLVLDPIAAAGFITTTKTTSGRGAKPFVVRVTPKFQSEVMDGVLSQLSNRVDPKLLSIIRKPLSQIKGDLNSPDRYTAGLALEAFALNLIRLVGMDYVKTRLRCQDTGGAEVDLVFESDRLVYSRWQVQCKNTKTVTLDNVAKEVGLTYLLKSNAIIMVTTGKFTSDAVQYAHKIMREYNISIVMINGEDISRIVKDQSHIVTVFQREAKNALQIKKITT